MFFLSRPHFILVRGSYRGFCETNLEITFNFFICLVCKNKSSMGLFLSTNDSQMIKTFFLQTHRDA